jgi:hypothetical protein
MPDALRVDPHAIVLVSVLLFTAVPGMLFAFVMYGGVRPIRQVTGDSRQSRSLSGDRNYRIDLLRMGASSYLITIPFFRCVKS